MADKISAVLIETKDYLVHKKREIEIRSQIKTHENNIKTIYEKIGRSTINSINNKTSLPDFERDEKEIKANEEIIRKLEKELKR